MFSKQFFINRLQEGSTIRGILMLISSFTAFQFSESQTANIVLIVTGIGGLLGTLLPDKIPAIKKSVNTEEEVLNDKRHIVEDKDFEDEPLVVVPKENSVDWDRFHSQ